MHSYPDCALLTFSCNFKRINNTDNATHFAALGAKMTFSIAENQIDDLSTALENIKNKLKLLSYSVSMQHYLIAMCYVLKTELYNINCSFKHYLEQVNLLIQQ